MFHLLEIHVPAHNFPAVLAISGSVDKIPFSKFGMLSAIGNVIHREEVQTMSTARAFVPTSKLNDLLFHDSPFLWSNNNHTFTVYIFD